VQRRFCYALTRPLTAKHMVDANAGDDGKDGRMENMEIVRNNGSRRGPKIKNRAKMSLFMRFKRSRFPCSKIKWFLPLCIYLRVLLPGREMKRREMVEAT